MPRKPAASREQLLNVATRLFAEKGFPRTTLDEIAKEAGVNKAMIHYYWRTKTALYEELYGRLFEEFSKKLEKTIFDASQFDFTDPEAKEKITTRVATEVLSFVEQDPNLARMMARHMMGEVPGTDHLKEKYARPVFKRASDALENYMNLGIVRRQNLPFLVASICFMVLGYYIGGGEYLLGGEDFINNQESRDKLKAHLSDIMYCTLKAD